MTDRQILLLGVAAFGGALVPVDLSWALLIAAVMVAVAVAGRRPILLILACCVLASGLSARAWARQQPAAVAAVESTVTLLNDPASTAGGVRVHVDLDGARLDARAWSSPAGYLRDRLMGERVQVDMTVRPLVDAPRWLRARGIVGRATITSVDQWQYGTGHTRIANSIRRTISAGASQMTRDERSLFTGLVYGDDREQSPLVADNFAAAGLTHLLAVSGQNVAFVLAIVGPVLRRLKPRPRFIFVVTVLVLFATVTRFEASVIRASVMTAVAATGALVGSQMTSKRVLGLAVVGLVLVHPLIVHSIAFQLSIAASAGILWWSARLALALPGPRPFAELVAVTSAAQIAVSPLVVVLFGGLPVASLPANVLAGPAAGPVMMWGLTVGWVAGVVPESVAAILHTPTKLALRWIDGVAAAVTALPLGELGPVHLAGLFIVGSLGLRSIKSSRRLTAFVAIVILLMLPALEVAARSPASAEVDGGAIIIRDDAVTVVRLAGAPDAERVLAGIRRADVASIDLLVVAKPNGATRQLIEWLETRHDIGKVWSPAMTLGLGESLPPPQAQFSVDHRVYEVAIIDGALQMILADGPDR